MKKSPPVPCLPGLFGEAPAPLTPVEEARAVGHRAAEKAGAHAETVQPDWIAEACQHVLSYGHSRAGEAWLIEDAKAHAEARGLAKPPDARAWGAVTQALKRSGEIVFVGYASAKTSNGSPKCEWRVA